MKKSKHSLIFSFLFFCMMVFSNVSAQDNNRMLADQFFYNGEYDKAAQLYEDLYNSDPYGIYPNYYRALVALRNFDQAEKIVKKQIKNVQGDLGAVVDLGYIYQLKGDVAKAEQQYDKAIKQLTPDQGQIAILANSFMMKQDLDRALNVYLEGKKLLRGQYGFFFEAAEVYSQKGNFEKMIDEYVGALEENSAYQQSIQNILQMRVANDPDGSRSEMLRTAMLRKIQKNPDQLVFADVLIWLFTQQKDFESAFIQAKAIDKRLQEDGNRIYSLASLSSANLNYDAAIKCYQYLIEKGKSFPLYYNARIDLLNTLNEKITESSNYTQADLIKLETDYQATLNELGKSARTLRLMRGLAHLWVFYLNKSDSAIALLEDAIQLPSSRGTEVAECKLELGDIYLFEGNVWDSDLLYAQVDKAFKNDPLGQEAKFRSAKLDYYRGDFLYAQAQLDVLKSATSQLIANDATGLSLMISDNIGIDSVFEILNMYAQADLLFYRQKYDESLSVLDSLEREFISASILPQAWFKKAEIYNRKKQYAMQDSLLTKVIDHDQRGILADDALFEKAELAEQQFKDKSKAMDLYEKILTDYPGSLFTVEARKRFRTLRGDLVN